MGPRHYCLVRHRGLLVGSDCVLTPCSLSCLPVSHPMLLTIMKITKRANIRVRLDAAMYIKMQIFFTV